jgi:putative ABC transport system permease protein
VTGFVLGEALLLTTLAGLVGLGLAALASVGLASAVQNFMPIFYVPPNALVLGVVFALLLGVASGGLPAYLAQRLTIVVALRRR